jgi:phosphatidylserine/phosphatidylglycerophosphate/cardiolipin synthase-like enzyme
LHAKFFICDLAPVPFALVGSANSTAQSFANYELGVFIRGSGEAEGVIRDLQSLAVELRGAGKRVKRRALA